MLSIKDFTCSFVVPFLLNHLSLASLVIELCHLASSVLSETPGTQVVTPLSPLIKPTSFMVSIFLLAKSIDISNKRASTKDSFFNLLFKNLTNLTTEGFSLSVTFVTKVKVLPFFVFCPNECNSDNKSFTFTGFLSFFLLSSKE